MYQAGMGKDHTHRPSKDTARNTAEENRNTQQHNIAMEDIGRAQTENHAESVAAHREATAVQRESNVMDYKRQVQNDALDSRAALAKVYFGDTGPEEAIQSKISSYIESLGKDAVKKYKSDPAYKKQIDAIVREEILGSFNAFASQQAKERDAEVGKGGLSWKTVQ